MRTIILLFIIPLFVAGCRNDYNQTVVTALTDNEVASDTTSYPILIDEGTRIVFQVGHMTADKGLKLYLDTIPNPSPGFWLEESLRRELSIK